VRIRIAILQRVWKYWTSPLSKCYFSGVQSQNIYFAAASSRSWNSISSIVPRKMISILANVAFSQHGSFTEKILNQLQTFWIVKIGIKSSENTKYIRINFKYLFVFLRKQCFGMLRVLENEISLWKRSGGTAHLRILEGTMISSIWILAVFTHFHVSFASFQNWIISVTIVCKATTVTHTKRIDRNLLRKETSFVCYTSSVLRKIRHMKQKEKITHCC